MLGGQGLASMAFTIAVIVLLARTEPFAHVIRPDHLHDLGKLMLAFVMLWAYFSFSQFLIIWSANLPVEITFYLTRIEGGWGYVGLLVILGHFVLPFLLLLIRDLKRGSALALRGALHHLHALRRSVLADGAARRARRAGDQLDELRRRRWPIGGIWVAVFLWQLGSRPLLPLGDQGLAEVLESNGH